MTTLGPPFSRLPRLFLILFMFLLVGVLILIFWGFWTDVLFFLRILMWTVPEESPADVRRSEDVFRFPSAF